MHAGARRCRRPPDPLPVEGRCFNVPSRAVRHCVGAKRSIAARDGLTVSKHQAISEAQGFSDIEGARRELEPLTDLSRPEKVECQVGRYASNRLERLMALSAKALINPP